MSVVKAIYNAPIVYELVEPFVGYTIINISYNGIIFGGRAQLSEKDRGFFARGVGKTIAISKARIAILKYELKSAKTELKHRNNLYQEVTKYGKLSPAEVDPTGNLYQAIMRIEKRIDALSAALKKEKKDLKAYLRNQDKALNIVRRLRKDNNN